MTRWIVIAAGACLGLGLATSAAAQDGARVAVRFENAGIASSCDAAPTLGTCCFSPARREEIEVECSFAYARDAEGRLRIVPHHASPPYRP